MRQDFNNPDHGERLASSAKLTPRKAICVLLMLFEFLLDLGGFLCTSL